MLHSDGYDVTKNQLPWNTEKRIPGKTLFIVQGFFQILDALIEFLDFVFHQHTVRAQPADKYNSNGTKVFEVCHNGFALCWEI